MDPDVLRVICYQSQRTEQVSHAPGLALHGSNVPPTGMGIPRGIPAPYIRPFRGRLWDVRMCCLWLHEVGVFSIPGRPLDFYRACLRSEITGLLFRLLVAEPI